MARKSPGTSFETVVVDSLQRASCMVIDLENAISDADKGASALISQAEESFDVIDEAVRSFPVAAGELRESYTTLYQQLSNTVLEEAFKGDPSDIRFTEKRTEFVKIHILKFIKELLEEYQGYVSKPSWSSEMARSSLIRLLCFEVDQRLVLAEAYEVDVSALKQNFKELIRRAQAC